jgi:hypothetical protein
VHNKRSWERAPSIAWEKIPILLRSFEQNDHDWHIFIDADIFITNFDKRVEDFLGDRAVYMGSDWNFPLNMGFVAMQATALPLLQALKQLRMSNPYGLFEQGATQVIREVSEYWKEQVVALEHNICNSYAPNRTEKWEGSWEEGDFVVHFAGWPVAKVLDFLKPALEGSTELSQILAATKQEIQNRLK